MEEIMKFDEMEQAVRDAERTMKLANICANQLARLLVGRLRKVDEEDLEKLKRELRDFNMHTHRWKP
tara:strand:+ start:102 stop:302 length:201 start_codon:yes stop_codon:yes gene_type:complete